jgi:hypothetical protein
MQLFQGPLRLALLLTAVAAPAVAIPTVSIAQDTATPQCSDGVDNDGDGAIDGFDPGCGSGTDDNETDSPYSGIQIVTVALPLVTIQGTVDRKGVVHVSRLQLRAKPGTAINITCTGAHCPFKTSNRRMITKTLRLTVLERKLKPTMTIQMRLQKPGQLGKYVSYKVRRRKAPIRVDACLDQDTGKVKGCFDDRDGRLTD